MDPIILTAKDVDEAIGMFLARRRNLPEGTPYVADFHLFTEAGETTIDRIEVHFPNATFR